MDAVEISMGRSLRDRLLDLELNKSDLTEIPAQDARHAAERGIRVSQSQPEELLAVVFLENRASSDARARQALSLSLDRTAIVTYLLQKFGEPSAALLPQWCAVLHFYFPSRPICCAPRNFSPKSRLPPQFVLGYDSADPLEAKRGGANCGERKRSRHHGVGETGSRAAIGAKTWRSGRADALLVRVTMDAPTPATR